MKMLDKNHQLPLGKLLQKAGLVSQQQIEQALKSQADYSQMQLGEILVLQNAVKSATVSFFCNRWQEILHEGQQFAIGHYLQAAGLLNDQQIQLILAEQKNSQQKFGAIAVAKGWLNYTTAEFFANSLTPKTPELISLESLEKYDRQTSNLARKYSGSNLILTRILAWTRGNLTLTKTIYHAFAAGDFNLSPGQEILAIDRLIETRLIQKWQTDKLGEHVRYVCSKLTTNQNCNPLALLQQYREILLSGSQPNQHTAVQQELLTLGLIVEEDQLKLGNLLYQQIFNQDWLAAKIAKLELADQLPHKNLETSKPKSNQPQNQLQRGSSTLGNSSENKLDEQYVQNILSDIDALDPKNTPPELSKPKATSAEITPSVNIKTVKQTNPANNAKHQNQHLKTNTPKLISTTSGLTPEKTKQPLEIKTVQQIDSLENARSQNALSKTNTPEPITKAVSLVTLLGLVLLVPLVWLVNNYYFAKSPTTSSDQQPIINTAKLQQFCQELNLVDTTVSLESIAKLESSQQELANNVTNSLQTLPQNCEVALNKLRVLAAPQLGRESRVIEAVKNLCQIPADSESLNEAKIWLDHWYDSPNWGKETKQYLTLISDCPANDR